MLIHLSAKLIKSLEAELQKNETAIQALQNIAQARYQGDHIITADNGVLDFIIASKIFNQTTHNVFSKINLEQTQIGGLRKKLTAYINIECIQGDTKTTEEEKIKIINIPLARFERNDIIQPTFFIAENLLDCQFYLIITSWFSKKYKNGFLPSKLNAVYCPGGGDTTEKLLSHHSQSQRYLTLCITDSDQKFPGASLGETTKKCRQLALRHLSHHLTLPTRSVENLICHNQIVAVLNSTKERKALLPRLNRLNRLINNEAWKYFHVKEGVRNFHGPNRPETENSYWQGVATTAEWAASTADGYVFPPITQKLLLWVVEHLEKNEPEEIKPNNQLFEIWEDLAHQIASWTCASEPIRS